jgi:DNA-binding NarL/FixJ family response regulator
MRIILADHHPQSRWAVKMLLDEEEEFDLIGEAVDTQELLVLAEQSPVDLVLVDRELPGIDIEELITRLRALPQPPIILVMSSEAEYGRRLLNAGADAFISKGDSPDWLVEKLYKYAHETHQSGGGE